MRLHRLQLTAFGPFAGTEEVDFDALNDAGLFLLTGPTGAGKTSILDAVCFALYGTVPGVRGVKTLKSQHADDLVAPEVFLDFSVRERRFRLRRSPEWTRPKRRGTGTRVEPARASLLEVVDGEERLLSSRAAEVGLQISDLVGMRAAQFQQVAMLPQGDFARFLQASSQDRHDVLQQLFQTDRFSRIEDWIQDRSRSLREEAQDLEGTARRLLDLVAERSGEPLPDAVTGDGLPAAVGSGAVEAWVTSVRDAAHEAAAAAGIEHQRACDALAAARTRCEAARLRHRLHERRRQALARRRELDETRDAAEEATAALGADRRAADCAPLLGLVEQASADVALLEEQQQAAAARAAALPALPDLPRLRAADLGDEAVRTPTGSTPVPGSLAGSISPTGSISPAGSGSAVGADEGHRADGGARDDDLVDVGLFELDEVTPRTTVGPASDHGDTHTDPVAATAPQRVEPSPEPDPQAPLRRRVDVTRDLVPQLRAVLPRAAGIVADTARIEQLERRLSASRSEIALLQEQLGRLPELLARQREHLARLASVAGRAEAVELQLAAAETRSAAVAGLPAARARVSGLVDLARDARDAAADRRDTVQRITQLRLDGMAAELAGVLVDGEPCQVCGSPAHPAPAAPGGGQVSQREQDDAAAAFDAAQQRHVAAAAAAAEAERDLQQLLAVGEGRDAATVTAELVALRAEQADCAAARSQLTAVAAEVTALEQQQVEASTRVQGVTVSIATTEHSVESLRESVAEARHELRTLLGDDVEPEGVAEVIGVLERSLQVWRGQLELVERVRQARDRRDDLLAQAARAAAAGHFADLEAVRAARLDDDDRERLTAVLTARSEATARVQAVLEDPDVAGLEHAGPEAVRAAETQVEAAATAAEEVARRFHQLEEASQALTGHATRLAATLEDWAPMRESFVRADAMARLVRGMGSDNQLQMRLSAYVLARRLDQVLDAANERLAHMRDQRYLLQRTARAARRSSQAGLGLEVVDQWTGDVRDPVTLSGGETFVVSLALALGLADVVTQEAGGTEIETLFVDEGFGTLDPETLDDVMDRLDNLRSGGRSVGVVSHVGELRSRIPNQLHVLKTPHGSSIRAQLLVG
ncbi:AAA family ATPase [Nocardioides mesophilus]|uniref:Nuclease SbcCD subunit C n=1 Tax=Nocardioides mesophilus TaxID=433659 RepID=A0A7G9RAS8_9ACTN|nr:SMC family ATPase [Nocardioides mesophilus]QNN52703.1 SMC family ATPase [Nocardioides mesophilus]